MNLFNFLKPKEKDPLDDPSLTPVVRRGMLLMELDQLKNEFTDLREQGRNDDSNKLVIAYLSKCLREAHRKLDHPNSMSLYVNAIISFGSLDSKILDIGEKSLIAVIDVWMRKNLVDVTTITIDLGRIFHQMRNKPEIELATFEMAAIAVAPKKCKYPASPQDKARAHNFAYVCASRIGNNEKMFQHDDMRRKFVPDLAWDDRETVLKWMQDFCV